ncbi:2OG-Fe(II) oxygenase [Allocoleopsis sp.]|uniref:2OG-Fe(II) oxygenase n=1 Tax=Allocoleopsis sp. TaxID=3088169 RepID=UPI002FD4AE1A
MPIKAFKPKCTVHRESLSHLLLPLGHDKTNSSKYLEPRFRFVIPSSNKVRVVRGLLSAFESTSLIHATESLGFSTPTAFDKSVRACERRHTVDLGMSDAIMLRLKSYLPEIVQIDGVRWRLKRFTHHWRYIKYFSKGHFVPHYDGAKMLQYPTPSISIFTVQIYLNDDFTGGNTRFYSDYEPVRYASHDIPLGEVKKFKPSSSPTHEVKPEVGSVLIFDHVNNVLHDGAEVKSGVKYIMRGDVLYEVFEEDISLLLHNVSTLAPNILHWCPETAIKYGTRNHIGEVWLCDCADDGHGSGIHQCETFSCADEYVSKEDSNEKKVEVSPASTGEFINGLRAKNVQPLIYILVSGKRASGKDYITNLLYDSLIAKGISVYRTALGHINKRSYAASIGIDAMRLENDREFKESHRLAMIAHHTARNAQDPEWCLKEVISNAKQANAEVLLLSDIRTLQDLHWFKRQPGEVVLLRITASDETRKLRGWYPCPKKDSLHTETELDSFLNWTACWDNSDFSKESTQLLHEWIEYTVIPRIPLSKLRFGAAFQP